MKNEESAFDILAKELSFSALTPEEEELIGKQSKGKESYSDEDDETEEEIPENVEETEEEDEDEEENSVETKPATSKNKENKTKDEVESLDEYEEDITKFVKDKLEAKLGVSLKDFTKVDEIVDELAQMVEESTKDAFANDEVAELNEYVRNGGDLKKFYSDVYNTGVDLDIVDIENTSDQKRIVKENLKNRGYSDKQVDRMLTRYEDSGVLQEEAEDAIEIIKEHREIKKKELLEGQRKSSEVAKKRNEDYVKDVQKNIKELKDVFGIPVSEKDKKEIYNALFIPDTDGSTKYQKVVSNSSLNLIISAFFALKGDDLIKRAQSKGATTTVKTLKEKLSQHGNRMKKSGTRDEDVDALSLFSRQLRKD